MRSFTVHVVRILVFTFFGYLVHVEYASSSVFYSIYGWFSGNSVTVDHLLRHVGN